ncbi:hypothetical protein [Pararhizobium sp.]|uniref:hypothetical protein n=1 Tax=Pararhizobium sp. TaxID=1977563 RepID=UPI003D0E4AA8
MTTAIKPAARKGRRAFRFQSRLPELQTLPSQQVRYSLAERVARPGNLAKSAAEFFLGAIPHFLGQARVFSDKTDRQTWQSK